MSLNIGDNFQYLGKKFLDARESFATLADMKKCTDVPDGFITYCQENDTRYEFKNTNANNVTTGHWREFAINTECVGGGGISAVIQEEEPDDTSVIWFDPDEENDIPKENPFISELKAIIFAMSAKIDALTARVEYLENIVSSGSGGGDLEDPDDPFEPDIPEPTGYQYLLLEDGTPLLWEDGSYILLEEQQVNIDVTDVLLLEDGTPLLWEDGGFIFLETRTEKVEVDDVLLLEDGSPLLLEDGGFIFLESKETPVEIDNAILLESGDPLLLESGDPFLLEK
jgi:hypothetical protein